LQRAAALVVVALVAGAAAASWWPFDASPRSIDSFARPTVWQYLFGDRLTLGFARLAVAGSAIYVVASVPALVVAGRWAKGFGTTGLTTDDAVEATKTLQELTRQTDELTAKLEAATEAAEQARGERDRALELLSAFVDETTDPGGAPMMQGGDRGDDDG